MGTLFSSCGSCGTVGKCYFYEGKWLCEREWRDALAVHEVQLVKAREAMNARYIRQGLIRPPPSVPMRVNDEQRPW